MLKYIFKRLLVAIPLIFVITIICFLLIYIAPYDAVDAMVSPKMSKQEIEAKKEQAGLNDPFYVQYGKWFKNLCHGEWGYSLTSGTNIRQDLRIYIPNTIKLVLPSYFTAFFLSIILGLIAGSNYNKQIDRIIDAISSVGIAMPTFWFALMAMYVFGYHLKIFPLMGMHTIGKEKSLIDFIYHFTMPYVVLTIGFLPELVRYVRSSTISEFKEDYVLIQKSFGSSKTKILLNHVSKNVMLPMVTKLGMALPMLVTGAIITETIFAWPGVGTYYMKAIRTLDYPIVMIILVLSGTLVILGNLLADILYCLIDPRIRITE
jgi:peptide/nickel transport system permease protein